MSDVKSLYEQVKLYGLTLAVLVAYLCLTGINP